MLTKEKREEIVRAETSLDYWRDKSLFWWGKWFEDTRRLRLVVKILRRQNRWLRSELKKG